VTAVAKARAVDPEKVRIAHLAALDLADQRRADARKAARGRYQYLEARYPAYVLELAAIDARYNADVAAANASNEQAERRLGKMLAAQPKAKGGQFKHGGVSDMRRPCHSGIVGRCD
jgi:hypothetical protein